MYKFYIIIIFSFLFFQCKKEKEVVLDKKQDITEEKQELTETKLIDLDTVKFTDGYDFPVGKPDSAKYYNAQKFQENNHLGDDWNGVGGGNSDLGDNIYVIANGYVSFAEDIKGGWGKVLKIIHYNPDKTKVESLYAHCMELFVKEGQFVSKGERIATIGNADGVYLAHLHLEIRNKIGMPIGNGYSTQTEGYLDPTKFIKNNR